MPKVLPQIMTSKILHASLLVVCILSLFSAVHAFKATHHPSPRISLPSYRLSPSLFPSQVHPSTSSFRTAFHSSLFSSKHSSLSSSDTATTKRVVLITGCSTGIGKSTAEEFLKDPRFKVWATMRNPNGSTLPDTAKDLQAEDRLSLAAMDVTSTESIEECIAHIIQADKHLDIVINNAGYGLAGTLETVTLEEAKQCMEVNLWGVARVLQAALPHMRRQRFGQIINLSSTSGVRGVPCMDFYTASKFALEGLMDSMRYSVMPYGITVTNVNAGPAIQTSFSTRCGNDAIGGKGTRVLPQQENDPATCSAGDDYLHAMVEKTVTLMREKMLSANAQSSESVAQGLVELVNQRLSLLSQKDPDLTSIPFNIGSNAISQGLLEETRNHPTGWGGIFTNILKSMPPVDSCNKDSV